MTYCWLIGNKRWDACRCHILCHPNFYYTIFLLPIFNTILYSIHPSIHTYIHTDIHTYIHTYILTYLHTYTHTHRHTSDRLRISSLTTSGNTQQCHCATLNCPCTRCGSTVWQNRLHVLLRILDGSRWVRGMEKEGLDECSSRPRTPLPTLASRTHLRAETVAALEASPTPRSTLIWAIAYTP